MTHPDWTDEEVTDMRDQRWEALWHLAVATLAATAMWIGSGDRLTLVMAVVFAVMAALMGVRVWQDRKDSDHA
jgi:hypothetical protein